MAFSGDFLLQIGLLHFRRFPSFLIWAGQIAAPRRGPQQVQHHQLGRGRGSRGLPALAGLRRQAKTFEQRAGGGAVLRHLEQPTRSYGATPEAKRKPAVTFDEKTRNRKWNSYWVHFHLETDGLFGIPLELGARDMFVL